MDGNSAKKAPVLDHLVSTNNAPNGQSVASPASPIAAQPLPHTSNGATPNKAGPQAGNPPPASPQQNNQRVVPPQATPAANRPQQANTPQNRRTDKSQFEIELANTVNQIMLKHFEHASEQIVQQVLNEVRARLPGQRKE